MKQVFLLGLVVCLTGTVYANPVIFDPIGSLAFVLVLISAVAMEAGLVTLTLLFWGMEPKPIYIALYIANVIVYFTVFFPLVRAETNLWIAEAIVVAIDGVLIKMLTRYVTFRDATFRPLRWQYAFLIAAVGNLVSYYVGVVITG